MHTENNPPVTTADKERAAVGPLASHRSGGWCWPNGGCRCRRRRSLARVHSADASFAAESTLGLRTEQAAIPSVTVTQPSSSGQAQEIVLPGNTEPFNATPIFTPALMAISKAGTSTSALMSSRGSYSQASKLPEVDQQLEQARTDLEEFKVRRTSSLHRSQRHAGRISLSELRLAARPDQAVSDPQRAPGDRIDSMNAERPPSGTITCSPSRKSMLPSRV